MARRSFAIPFTALIAGATGFAAGVYLAPTDEAKEFGDLLRSSIGASTETSTAVSPPPEAPQAKVSEEAKSPPEAAAPVSPMDSRDNPPAEMVGAEPKPTTTSKPTAPVTPEAVSEPKPAAAAFVSPAKPRAKKPKRNAARKTSPVRSH
jgi:hypothetical protein